MSYFALIPAAGSGARMGIAQPKQYLPLNGQILIWHVIATFCVHPRIEKVYVVLAPDDTRWREHDWSAFAGRLEALYCGGETRAESVANGLQAVATAVGENDWVLVHDAARPCLGVHHLDALIDEVGAAEVGGILAIPAADTLKRGAGGRIAATVPRTSLWQAQTPQMFRRGLLIEALGKAMAAGREVTDESSAVESCGYMPRLVAADATNLKVTYPLDLQLAGWILQNRARGG